MIARTLSCLLIICSAFNSFGHSDRSIIYISTFYRYSVDLRDLENDQLKIELHVAALQKDEVIFCLPKVVPGIYGAMNFGQYLVDLKAFDNQEQVLEIEKLDQNRWKIKGAGLEKITYSINDGWEEFNEHKENRYLSAESSFQENKAFVINHNALFGYLEGFESKSIQLEIKKPEGFYGATSLNRTRSRDNSDYYIAKNYRYLVDNPILYSIPDTTNFKVGDTYITVAMYSATGKKLSKEIAGHIKPLLESQKAYLGGKLPVKNYTFILYHNENPEKNNSLGDGLEHSNSTLILMYMPLDLDMIKWNVYGIASHEFFHTLLPLGLHSEEIAYYNFNQPKLSQHIWLYEGMTEYFTLHMPVKQQAETMDVFLSKIKQKIDQMENYSNDRSLTYLSVNAIENQYDYYNFYLKGALVNLCLDIELRELSKGKYGVQDLISDMIQVYEGKPFKDDELFDVMTKISKQPEIRKFFAAYIEGTEVLPLKNYFQKVGIDFDPETNNISWTKKPSKAQLKLRKSWIGQ